MIERKELWRIKELCKKEVKVKSLNPSWRRIYLRLMDAADYLDAKIARLQVRQALDEKKDGEV